MSVCGPKADSVVNSFTRNNKVLAGLVAGLLATIAMDIVMVGVFVVMGRPSNEFFLFIGSAVKEFLSIIGLTVHGGAAIGATLHYLIGLLLGLLFGVKYLDAKMHRAISPKRIILVSVLVTQVVSLILLLPAIVILKMGISTILQLLVMAVFFHLVYGIILGGVVYRELKGTTSA